MRIETSTFDLDLGGLALSYLRNAKRALNVGLFSTAIGLFAVHGLFHLWEWLWWPPPDALNALYGATDAGRLAHALTEAMIALALVLGLWTTIRAS